MRLMVGREKRSAGDSEQARETRKRKREKRRRVSEPACGSCYFSARSATLQRIQALTKCYVKVTLDAKSEKNLTIAESSCMQQKGVPSSNILAMPSEVSGQCYWKALRLLDLERARASEEGERTSLRARRNRHLDGAKRQKVKRAHGCEEAKRTRETEN